MANGGHISCSKCTYGRRGNCDIWGIEANGFILCRAFRLPKQSHTEARKAHKILGTLKPGYVYGIDNSVITAGNPAPIYEVVRIESAWLDNGL